MNTNRIPLTLGLLLIVVGVGILAWPTAGDARRGTAPDLPQVVRADEPTFDFGTRRLHDEVGHTFVLRNHADAVKNYPQ